MSSDPIILIVGGGGREHALAWKIAQDSSRPRIYCAPGNAGTASIATNLPITATDIPTLLHWAKAFKPALTVVGPEAPLCAGIADAFAEAGFRVFGPSAAAARLEGSKMFAKEVMQAAGVPTAGAWTFTNADEAKAFVRQHGAPLVVKADGLAAGKGVTVCTKTDEAINAIDDALVRNVFGSAGSHVLIEEFLEGEEASILALIDGEHVVMLASSQDHKRVFDHDEGPNTGGMGAYSPAPVVNAQLWPLIREQVFDRTLAELRKRGIVFKGILYAGIMLTRNGPKVLEFNTRFGDPETEAILPRWDGDMLPALHACVDGTLSESHVKWKPEACACIVMAAGGYPGTYQQGLVIEGLADAARQPGVVVFHSGTRVQGADVVTAGGRVLAVAGSGPTLRDAVDRAYAGARAIRFDGAHYRKDIAWRALTS